MHHLVADSEWSDTALLAAVAREVVPVLSHEGQAPCFWIIDDTSYRKWGKHSVGVARQYCGHLGKTENCQVAVSLTLATEAGSVPLNYRLYLPQEWTRNKKRCQAAGVPKAMSFATKGEIAWAQIEAALARASRVARCSWMLATVMRRRCAIGSARTTCPTQWRCGRQPRCGAVSINPRPHRASSPAVGPAPACDATRGISRSVCSTSPERCPRRAGA